MSKRINFNDVQPGAYDAMEALDKFVDETSIDKLHKEFIKIRASQINGCAYCVDSHSHDALKLGETLQKVLLISAWREARKYFFGRRDDYSPDDRRNNIDTSAWA